MPALANSRHELFARALAKGKSQQQAYVIAGYKPHISNPSHLAKDKRIQARVAEIHSDTAKIDAKATEKAAQALSLDKQWVLSRLARNASVALADEPIRIKVLPRGASETIEVEVTAHDAAAANRALELIGKEFGMFVERTENLNVNHVVSDEPLTDEQWSEQFAAEARH